MFWLLDGRKEADRMKVRAQVEVPPPGYTGSLAGTSWDDDAMLNDYEQGKGTITEGEMN